MSIPIYTPALSVNLIKMVARQSDGLAEVWQDASRQVDLTPFLGSSGIVQTTKSLHGDPAGGFVIAFADQPDIETQDSLYARIEPMDLVEIRASRTPEQYNGGNLPLIMRGFVSNVRRSESIGDDGEPRRTVIVNGHDFGKLWQIHAVWNETATITDTPALTIYGLQTVLGLNVEVEPIETFMAEFVAKVMNPKVAAMEDFTTQVVPDFQAEISVTQGTLIPAVIGSISDSTYWEIVAAVADMPWNELFIRDEEDGPHFVFRPAPFRDLGGAYILEGAADPGTVDVDVAEIVNLDVSRSDSRVANFYWVAPGTSSLDNNGLSTAASLIDGSALDFHYGNNNPALYGERKMQQGTALIADDAKAQPSTLPIGQRPAEANRTVLWYRQRARDLQAMNRDNSVLEDGGVVLIGREDYVIGTYLRITRGELTSEAYVTAVSHSIPPLGGWTSTLSLERGTGFLERQKRGDGVFYGESRTGPYSL